MNSNARALKILDRLQASTGLSSEGRSALIQLANPFSDFEFVKAGYPDSVESASIVQCIKRSAVIQCPASVVSGTWDCNIVTMPFLGSVPMTGGTNCLTGEALNIQLSTAPIALDAGPVTIFRGQSGSALGFSNFIGARADAGTFGTELGDSEDDIATSFLDGTSRLIGVGFEVHNTTSQLNKQGSICVYRMPQTQQLDRQSRSPVRANNLTAPNSVQHGGGVTTITYADVPSTLASALLLSGSQQWEAADGCMVIPTLSSDDLPPTRREAIVPIIAGSATANITLPLSTGSTALVMSRSACPAINFLNGTTAGNQPQTSPIVTTRNKFSNFNSSGAFFTGLSIQTTLTVNVIYYVERFPAAQELDLVVMANPSPKHDLAFWPLYAACIREMPVGVKVGDNADGDWFYNLVSGAAKFIQPAFSALGGPIGIGGDAIAKAAQSWADSKLAANANAARVARERRVIAAAPSNSSKAQGSTWAGAGSSRKPEVKPNPNAPAWEAKGGGGVRDAAPNKKKKRGGKR